MNEGNENPDDLENPDDSQEPDDDLENPPEEGEPENPPEEETPAPPSSPAPPPAAKTVIKGKKTERDVDLRRKLKERETRIAFLEDENQRLKNPAPPAAVEKRSWLDDII